MKDGNAAGFAKLTTRMLFVLLTTMFVVGLWLLADMNAARAIVSTGSQVNISVGRTESLLVLILLFLNVAMAYAMFQRFKDAGKTVRTSLGTIIASLLPLCVWIGLRFLPEDAMATASDTSTGFSVNSSEIIMALFLILTSILGVLLMMRKFMRAKPYIVISAYSKKVNYKGEWISIEEYLQKELGIEVSHGMTPDERDVVMEDFRKRSAAEGINPPDPTK